MKFTDNQKAAINELTSNLQIIACAGSGKTEVVVQRIANIVLNKKLSTNQIVAFTFTNKAADELKQRINGLLSQKDINIDDMFIGTIHSFCWNYLKQLKEFNGFTILDDVKEFLFIKRYGHNNGMSDLNLSGTIGINAFKNIINKVMIEESNYSLKKEVLLAFNKYHDCLLKHKKISYAFIIYEFIKRIDSQELKEMFNNTKYLIVDEYQDVDDQQEQIINKFYNSNTNICVVGDDDQTIYQFRGSNANNMIEFTKRYENVRSITLDTNFRSRKNIVGLASHVIENNETRIKKDIKASSYELGNIESSIDDVTYIINKLLMQGYKKSDIAILSRSNKNASEITEILNINCIPNYSNNSYDILRSKSFTKLKNIINALSKVDLSAITEVLGITYDSSNIKKAFNVLRQERRTKKSLKDILETFLSNVQYIKDQETYEVMIKIISDFEEIYGDCEFSYKIFELENFIDNEAVELYKYHDFDLEKQNDAVCVMTIHKAKGLQFKNVIITNMNNGVFPMNNHGGINIYNKISYEPEKMKEKYEANIDDETKLLYVAITRAQDNLYFTYDNNKKLSIFMEDIYHSNLLTYGQQQLVNDLYPPSKTKKKDNDYDEEEHFKWFCRYGNRRRH